MISIGMVNQLTLVLAGEIRLAHWRPDDPAWPYLLIILLLKQFLTNKTMIQDNISDVAILLNLQHPDIDLFVRFSLDTEGKLDTLLLHSQPTCVIQVF